MRFVIFGAGAIGGVVGARLHQSGHAVTLIARGAHLDAIRRDGLTLVTPVERVVLPIPAVGEPGGVDWTGDEVVLLATKSQDTLAALTALRDAAGSAVPVVCLQNGVENERVALRLMDEVYGAVVMLPAAHLEAGCGRGLRRRQNRMHRRRPLPERGRRSLRGDLRRLCRHRSSTPTPSPT